MSTNDTSERHPTMGESHQKAERHGGPQDGAIGRKNGHQRQDEADILDNGGMGQGEEGQGKQRRPGGSSIDGKQQG
jgi:hypothetical protein